MRLSPVKIQEAQSDGTWKGWRPIPWGERSRENWESLGRPEKLPLDKPTAKLAEKVSTPEALRPILEKTIGADSAFFQAADGGRRVALRRHAHAYTAGRSPFVPLIPELLSDPFEVWMDFEEHEATGRVELKKRYIKYIKSDDVKGRGLYLVVQVVNGRLTGGLSSPHRQRTS